MNDKSFGLNKEGLCSSVTVTEAVDAYLSGFSFLDQFGELALIIFDLPLTVLIISLITHFLVSSERKT